MDLKSCQATHSGFVPGLSPQSIAMSLSSPMTSQALHQPQPQPPNLTLFGAAANLHGKATTPLTHIGIVPSNLQSAMLHLSRQQQEQPSGIVLPQNHFNPGTVFLWVPQFSAFYKTVDFPLLILIYLLHIFTIYLFLA